MRWTIDAGDAYSVAKVRHSVVEQLQSLGANSDLFNFETVLGELLGADMEKGHFALAVIIERGVGGPLVHVYAQGTGNGENYRGELRQAILRGTRLPMSVEETSQGIHYCLRVPMQHESPVYPSGRKVGRRTS